MLSGQNTNTRQSASAGAPEKRRKENTRWVLKATALSAAYSDRQSVLENTGRNLSPAAGVDHLIPYRTSLVTYFIMHNKCKLCI